jgi:hypothetical protein
VRNFPKRRENFPGDFLVKSEYGSDCKEEEPPMVPMLPRPRLILDRRSITTRQSLLVRILGEFSEMPCLRLTRDQARRLFGLRPDVCDRVLATLVQEGTLVCGTDGRYSIKGALQRRSAL